MSGTDHFAGVAAAYAAFRPHYPAALFEFLADAAPGRAAAWDCATGSGQAALGLAGHFRRVLATDASAQQVAHATPHDRVEYRVAPAERSGLADRSVDIVTVAQAAHWLDRPRFYAEARRVLAPAGVIAVWGYGRVTIAPEIDAVLRVFHDETLAAYWTPARRLVLDGYRAIEFPFAELTAPCFTIEHRLTLHRLAGYIRTWSATRAFIERHGRDPVDDLVVELSPAWGNGDAAAQLLARWPIAMRVGKGSIS